MNRWLSLIFSMICITGLVVGATSAINPQPISQPVVTGGEDVDLPRDELSPAQEQAMWEEIQRNIAMLRARGTLAAPDASQAVTYNFPLRLAPGLPDYAGFRVSAFVDHNPASGQVLDYNSGTRTYDGHRGTDYALYPFNWNKVDAGEVQVIAAAPGTIVGKANVDPTDHNPCDGGSSSDPWNYVALVHADGRMTIYGHIRYNSLTPKGIGQTVAQGETLGTAASSGNSSGPHLHFEARFGSFSSAEWIDPYAGPNSQPESLWTNQRLYYDSAINKLATHSSPPSTPDPCQPSMINLQDSFTTPRNIYFYTYYRDYQGALATQFNIYKPNGDIFQTWSYTSVTAFASAWSYAQVFAFSSNEPAGTWRFEATYNGQVYETFFNVNAPPAITVNSPNGGEQWDRTLTHSVTWTDNLGGDVNIALYHNGVYSTTIASNTPSDGAYLWAPDTALAAGPGYTIRVTSVINPALYDASDASLTLIDVHLIARDDFIMTPINTAITIDVLGNDEVPVGEPLTITAHGLPMSGTVSLVSAHLVYTPTFDFLGTDVFTYTVRTNTEQAEATVTVIVAAEVFHSFLPLIQR
jgi:murein DD-endopeptidase MepM/ murein hydrolase activator NlpD